MTPNELNILNERVEELYESLETEILRQVARRLKVTGTPEIVPFRLKKLSQLDLLNREVVEMLSMVSGVSGELIDRNIRQAGYDIVDETDAYMKMAGKEVLPQPTLAPLLNSYITQTFKEIDNLVNETLITTQFGEGTVSTMYRRILEESTFKFSSGTITLKEAIGRTMVEWADKGVPSAFIDKGGNQWRIESYVRTVLKSTNSRMYNELRTSRMAQYGEYTVLVGTKPKARPACALCQGKVLDTRPIGQNASGYPSVYEFGYGTHAGHRGTNCGHPWFIWIEGISKNNQRQYSEEESIKNEQIEQKRKAIARKIVKTKRRLVVAEELELPELERYKKLLRAQQKQMRDFITENQSKVTFNLRRNYDYEKLYVPLDVLVKEYKESLK